MQDAKIKVAVITSAAGIKGDIWVKSFIKPAKAIFEITLYDEDFTQDFGLKFSYEKKGKFRCRAKNIQDRNQAEALIGKIFYSKRSDLPKSQQSARVGVFVKSAQGGVVGKLLGVCNYGASDLLEVAIDDTTKKTVLIPLVVDYVDLASLAYDHIILQSDANSFFLD